MREAQLGSCMCICYSVASCYAYGATITKKKDAHRMTAARSIGCAYYRKKSRASLPFFRFALLYSFLKMEVWRNLSSLSMQTRNYSVKEYNVRSVQLRDGKLLLTDKFFLGWISLYNNVQSDDCSSCPSLSLEGSRSRRKSTRTNEGNHVWRRRTERIARYLFW